MNTQAILQCMFKMKVDGMAASYKSITGLCIDKEPETHQCIATLIDSELQNRAHKKTFMLLRF